MDTGREDADALMDGRFACVLDKEDMPGHRTIQEMQRIFNDDDYSPGTLYDEEEDSSYEETSDEDLEDDCGSMARGDAGDMQAGVTGTGGQDGEAGTAAVISDSEDEGPNPTRPFVSKPRRAKPKQGYGVYLYGTEDAGDGYLGDVSTDGESGVEQSPVRAHRERFVGMERES